METVLPIIAGLLAAALLFKPFFGTLAEFGECLRYCLTPDVVSLFRGEWGEDTWAELKVGLWVVLSVGCGVGVHQALVN